MRNKKMQGVAVRVQSETYDKLSVAARHLGWSVTALTNYILNDFVSSGRSIQIAMPKIEEPALEKPKPKADWSVWMDDEDEDEPADPDTLEQWR